MNFDRYYIHCFLIVMSALAIAVCLHMLSARYQEKPVTGLQALTKEECDRVRDAVDIVIDGLPQFHTVDAVILALRSYLPQTPRDLRDIVIDEFRRTTRFDINKMESQLLALKDALPY